MIIAQHCLLGAYRNTAGWHPECAWPERAYVQWGDNGVVGTNKGTYRTAFFEVLPSHPSTFIRGEGSTIQEAEQSAWAKWERIIACERHEMERKGYTNGMGFCVHCGLSLSGAFAEIPQEPTYLDLQMRQGYEDWVRRRREENPELEEAQDRLDALREEMEQAKETLKRVLERQWIAETGEPPSGQYIADMMNIALGKV